MSQPVALEDWLADPHGAAVDGVLRAGDQLYIHMDPPVEISALLGPIPLSASGFLDTPGAHPICVQGDELPPSLHAPLAYTSPPFVQPGSGTLEVVLGPGELSMHLLHGRPVLVTGGVFHVAFHVSVPAMEPGAGGPIPDPQLTKTGTGQFYRLNGDPYL